MECTILQVASRPAVREVILLGPMECLMVPFAAEPYVNDHSYDFIAVANAFYESEGRCLSMLMESFIMWDYMFL